MFTDDFYEAAAARAGTFVRTASGIHVGWLPVSVTPPAEAELATAPVSSTDRPAIGKAGGKASAGGAVVPAGPAGVEQADVEANTSPGGALTITASVESEDRAGDVIIAGGWQLDSYSQNPVVLWAHQHYLPPIARSVMTWVEGESLKASIEFAGTAFAQEIRRLYETGFMRGVSVGFRALETAARRGAGGRRGMVFRRQELLEISAAPVPLNPRALAGGERAMVSAPVLRQEALETLRAAAGLWHDLGQLAAAGN